MCVKLDLRLLSCIASNAARKLVPLVSTEPPLLNEAQLAEVVFPSVFELGAVRVTLGQANVLFDECVNSSFAPTSLSLHHFRLSHLKANLLL